MARLIQWEQQIAVILPQSKMKVMWDLFITIMRIYFMFLIPIQVAFP